jgi:hypothetical protein
MSAVLNRLCDTVDATCPTTPREYNSLAEDAVTLLAAILAKLPSQLRDQDLSEIEHGTLRAKVMEFDRKLHGQTYPPTNGGLLQ